MADKKKIVKRFSLTKEEKDKIQNIQSVIGIMALQREGLSHSITMELIGVRRRLNIKDADAPEGYERSVDFDYDRFDLVVTDYPKIEKKEEKDEVVEK